MIRLAFASRKLNVGNKTVLIFLSKNGFSIENNPNAKLTDKQYAMLCKEFESSASEKRAASDLTIGAQQKKKQKSKRGANLERVDLQKQSAKLEEKRKAKLEKNIAQGQEARVARENERARRKGPPKKNKGLWPKSTIQESRFVGRTVSITETEEDPLHRK